MHELSPFDTLTKTAKSFDVSVSLVRRITAERLAAAAQACRAFPRGEWAGVAIEFSSENMRTAEALQEKKKFANRYTGDRRPCSGKQTHGR